MWIDLGSSAKTMNVSKKENLYILEIDFVIGMIDEVS